MALNKSQLNQEIKQLMTDMKNREEDSIEEFAERLSNSIDNYVKGIKIVYTTGLANQGGAVTGSFTHTVQ